MDTDIRTIERIPPYSLDAERSVIGSMIMSGDAIMKASGMLNSGHFYVRQYGVFFNALVSIYNSGKPVDSVTIIEKLKEMKAPPELQNAQFIAELIESVPHSANIEDYAGIVRDYAVKRELIKVNEKIAAACYEGVESTDVIMARAEKEIFDLIQSRGSSEGLVPISSIVMDVLDSIQQVQKDGGNVTGIETGFTEIDRMTAGLQKSDFILIAARPSMGKTAFALNIAEYAAFRKGKSVMIFSLEMPKEQLVKRLISMESYVDASKLRIGDIQEKEWGDVIASAAIIGRSKLVIDDTAAISVAEMRTKCRRLKVESGLDMVLVDYLQLMSSDSTRRDAGRQQEISDISRSLKALARELNVPVVALSQLSRDVEKRNDKRPMLSDLRESGAIEQDADLVMFIYRDDYYNQDTEEKNIAEILISKQRNGATGTKKLLWRPEQTKFMNMEHSTQEE